MKNESNNLQFPPQSIRQRNIIESITLFPGIELTYVLINSDTLTHRHREMDQILEINYCRSGRLGWKMSNGNQVFLGPGDFSLHTKRSCAESVLSIPNGFCEGLNICIDLWELTNHPPELLIGTGIDGEALYNKYCSDGRLFSMAGNEQSENIFSALYNQPQRLRLPYQRIKVIELLLFLSKLEHTGPNILTEYRADQIEVIRQIHDDLLQHMEGRITIEVLSKKYLINPTTLKTVFKFVYGDSVAAHIKEHRMERAAALLRDTDQSILEIARAVGYDSQSKFTAAFKNFYHILPKEYRKTK